MFLAVLHGQGHLVPLQGPAVDFLQGQRVLGIVGVLLMGMRVVVVVVRRLGWVVAVVLLLLLLPFLGLLFAAGPLLVLGGHHPSLHRPLLQTLL